MSNITKMLIKINIMKNKKKMKLKQMKKIQIHKTYNMNRNRKIIYNKINLIK